MRLSTGFQNVKLEQLRGTSKPASRIGAPAPSGERALASGGGIHQGDQGGRFLNIDQLLQNITPETRAGMVGTGRLSKSQSAWQLRLSRLSKVNPAKMGPNKLKPVTVDQPI